MTEIKDEETTRELVNYFGRNYGLLAILYPNRTLRLHELATEAHKNPANLSKIVSTLSNERIGILETERVSRDRGRPLRCIRLSKRGHHLVSSAVAAATIPAKPRQYDPSAIDLMLDIMEDPELDEENRMLSANALHNLFTELPIESLTRHERLRKAFEKLLRDPQADGEVEERKRSMLKLAIPRLTNHEETQSWVLKEIQTNASKILENQTNPEKTMLWAIAMLREIGTRCPPKIWKKIKTKLLEIYFDDTLAPTNKILEELQTSILKLHCKSTESARLLTSHLRNRVKSANSKEKEKINTLLKMIIQYLVPVPLL